MDRRPKYKKKTWEKSHDIGFDDFFDFLDMMLKAQATKENINYSIKTGASKAHSQQSEKAIHRFAYI